jgi:alkylation response protein AidB-like acyl-CoA dehydrogenase
MGTTLSAPATKSSGGSFLIQACSPDDVFTPEDFTDQHKLIAQTAEEFATKEILPNIEKMEHKDFALLRGLVKKAGDLGLSAVDTPEAYGGLQMDKVTSAIIADRLARYGGFSATWGAHTCIGTLPIVYFGTEEQKRKYLPGLTSGEMVGAYALSEASSASDSLNCRTRAELSPDGKYYILNGEKTWITNAGFADLFTVFAKVKGEKFTAFLIERDFPGFSVGAEEHKMGIRGSSTCPLILTDCRVPVENVLGEIGKGHHIAFNVLNVGRFKLGAGSVGAARYCLEGAIAYAKQRKAFGKVIADFGLIREKLANMAVGIFIGESMAYRTVGMMDAAIAHVGESHVTDMAVIRKVIDEYAIECSILKVWGSEFLDLVVDEMVQVYGGYGFVEEYPAERAYRDSRVNRIFEGTNEINRLVITGFLLKRAISGQLPLMGAIKRLMDEVISGASADQEDGPFGPERRVVANAKKLSLFAAGIASQKYLQQMQDQQEIMGAIADMVIEAYAMDSAVLRAHKLAANTGDAGLARAMARVYMEGAIERIESSAKKVVAEVAEGDMLRSQMAIVRRLSKHEPFNTIALRKEIVLKVIESGKYVVA